MKYSTVQSLIELKKAQREYKKVKIKYRYYIPQVGWRTKVQIIPSNAWTVGVCYTTRCSKYKKCLKLDIITTQYPPGRYCLLDVSFIK